MSSSSYIRNFKLLACFCDCTGQFVSDLVGNPEDRFSRVEAQMIHMAHEQVVRSLKSCVKFDSLMCDEAALFISLS